MAFQGELRPFQKEAYDTILENGSCVLAYHMGLGKTVLTIAVIEELLETEQIRECLIVVPASLKYQWEKEIHRFSDCASVIVVDGPPQKRKRQYLAAANYEYVILTYEQVVNDWPMVKRLGHGAVVIDEATAIKNPAALRTKAIKQMKGDYRLALTGQPVENKPEELFSILEWVDKDVLGRFDIFDQTFIVRDGFGQPKRYKNLPMLREQVEGVVIRKRRDDPDVVASLPKVEEKTILVQMDPKGAKLYESIADDLFGLLTSMKGGGGFDIFAHYGKADGGGEGNQAQGEIMTRLLCLRMLCDHPDLIRYSADLYDETSSPDFESMQAGSKYASYLMANDALKGVTKHPKLDATVETIHEILKEDPRNKVVVFSFFKEMLAILGETVEEKTKTKTSTFTGDMNARQREAEKRRFQDDPETRVFLSSDAGGYGVDLPQANYLISTDLPWSAGKLDQRNARIIRLSSEWESVMLINMLIKGSVEERQYDMLDQKRKIAGAFLDGQNVDSRGEMELTLSRLSEFLADSAVG